MSYTSTGGTAVWLPCNTCTTSTNALFTSTTDWNFTTYGTNNNTWTVNITFDDEVDDKYGNCGGYIP